MSKKRPRRVATSAIKPLVLALDSDIDGRFTWADLEAYARKEHLPLSSAVLEKMCADALRSSDELGHNDGRITCEHVRQATSYRRRRMPDQSLSYVSRPYRQEWVMILSVFAGSSSIFEADPPTHKIERVDSSSFSSRTSLYGSVSPPRTAPSRLVKSASSPGGYLPWKGAARPRTGVGVSPVASDAFGFAGQWGFMTSMREAQMTSQEVKRTPAARARKLPACELRRAPAPRAANEPALEPAPESLRRAVRLGTTKLRDGLRGSVVERRITERLPFGHNSQPDRLFGSGPEARLVTTECSLHTGLGRVTASNPTGEPHRQGYSDKRNSPKKNEGPVPFRTLPVQEGVAEMKSKASQWQSSAIRGDAWKAWMAQNSRDVGTHRSVGGCLLYRGMDDFTTFRDVKKVTPASPPVAQERRKANPLVYLP